MKSKGAFKSWAGEMHLAHLITRSVCVLNIVLIGSQLLPWFGGTSKKPGIADAIFGAIRFGGFRVDFVWLAVSSIIFSLIFVVTIPAAVRDSSVRITAGLCLVEILAFAFLVSYSLISGTLYFG